MSRLSRNLLLGVSILLAAALAWLWVSRRPPALARLLPESDAVLYADLRPLHAALGDRFPLPHPSPEYQAFMQQTGIRPERDLDQAAFAITRRPDPAGPNGPVAFTEIFEGRFDATRLANYLASLAFAREQYAGHTLFLIPIASVQPGVPPRQLRVTLLGNGRVAASNAPTPEQLHSLLDRAGSALLPPSSLVARLYPELPRLTPLWGIGQLGLLSPTDPAAPGSPISLFGLSLPVPADEPLLLSLRYVGDLRLRVEALAPSRDLALQQAGAFAGLLSLTRSLAGGDLRQSANPALLAALSSLSVVQSPDHPDRLILSASLPVSLFLPAPARPRP